MSQVYSYPIFAPDISSLETLWNRLFIAPLDKDLVQSVVVFKEDHVNLEDKPKPKKSPQIRVFDEE